MLKRLRAPRHGLRVCGRVQPFDDAATVSFQERHTPWGSVDAPSNPHTRLL